MAPLTRITGDAGSQLRTEMGLIRWWFDGLPSSNSSRAGDGCIRPQVSPDLLDFAFNLAVATRMHVWDSEGGKSVAKSMPMWDNGRFRMGKGTSLPTGR